MATEIHTRHKGDTVKVLSATLEQADENGVFQPVDLSGLTVKFKMIADADDSVKVALTNATVTDALAGKCHYDFQAVDVDTKGTFWAYFVVEESSETTHYPVTRELKVIIYDD